jgi:hypothetical protein
VGLRVVIHNTIASTVGFIGTLTLPQDWQLVSGSAAINASLPPGQTMVLAYQVVPQTIRCEWDTAVYLRVGAATIAQCHDDVLLKQRGGLYPCGSEDDWLLTGQAPGGRKVYTADTERIPVRPNPSCGQAEPCVECNLFATCPVTSYSDARMQVTGRILALSRYPDSYLARLRLRVLEGNQQPPNEGQEPRMTGRELAEVRLDDDGWFTVCVERVPYFFLEVWATDELDCAAAWAAETVFERYDGGAKPKRYFAYSPVFSSEPLGCSWGRDLGELHVDLWAQGMTVERAAAFFPATQIAFEMEDFFSGHAGQTLRDSGALRLEHDYRASFVYPLTAEEIEHSDYCGVTAQACYREPHLYLATEPRNAALYGKIIEHEYGHRAHHAKGGWPGPIPCWFCESVAEFVRVAKEDETNITRGENAEYLPWPQELEPARNATGVPPGTNWPSDYYRWSPGLYDLFDSREAEQIDDGLYKCPDDPCPDIEDWSQLPFRNMWEVFTNQILDSSEPSPGKAWTNEYVIANGLRRPTDPSYQCQANDWYNMKRVSVYHAVYECTDTFPEAPPTATPPP